MIPVYNCSRFLPEAIRSVLQQPFTKEEMQIEVVDDASTDADVEALVTEVGKGRVGYFRQQHNVGSLRNFQTCINRAQGRVVHLLHGDDRVLPGYYQKMDQLLAAFPEAGAAFCRVENFNEESIVTSAPHTLSEKEGILQDLLAQISESNQVQYAGISVRREVYERLGSFFGVSYGEDWEMWTRIASHYPVAYTPAVLASYRNQSYSISAAKFRSGEYLKDLLFVIRQIRQYLPKEKRKRVYRRSRLTHAQYGIKQAQATWHATHDFASCHAQIKCALHLSAHYTLLYAASRVYLKMALQSLRVR
jgi:glycosyltransferase involved in cell wall biosynthesis